MSTSARFSSAVNADNTDRIRTNEYLAPAYATPLAVTPTKSYTLVKPGALTGALTITAGVGSSTTPPYVGDRLEFLFSASGADRIVTFSTGFSTAGTLTVVSAKKGSASFVFDGATWVEVGRALTA